MDRGAWQGTVHGVTKSWMQLMLSGEEIALIQGKEQCLCFAGAAVKRYPTFQGKRDLSLRFVTLYRRQGSRPSPWKRNARKQNGSLGRPYK